MTYRKRNWRSGRENWTWESSRRRWHPRGQLYWRFERRDQQRDRGIFCRARELRSSRHHHDTCGLWEDDTRCRDREHSLPWSLLNLELIRPCRFPRALSGATIQGLCSISKICEMEKKFFNFLLLYKVCKIAKCNLYFLSWISQFHLYEEVHS